MIDYLLAFDDEASAQADAVVGLYWVEGSWHMDVCIPDTCISNAQLQAITI